MTGNFEGIKSRRFGIEIEMTGITRCSAAKAIRDVLGGSVEHIGGSYDKYKIYDEDGRAWCIVSYAGIIIYKMNCKNLRIYTRSKWSILCFLHHNILYMSNSMKRENKYKSRDQIGYNIQN